MTTALLGKGFEGKWAPERKGDRGSTYQSTAG